MRVMIKTNYGDIVVDLDPTIPVDTILAFFEYANAGKYDNQPFDQFVAVGVNNVVVITAKTIHNETYSVSGLAEPADVLTNIHNGENLSPGGTANPAIILTVVNML